MNRYFIEHDIIKNKFIVTRVKGREGDNGAKPGGRSSRKMFKGLTDKDKDNEIGGGLNVGGGGG